MLAEAVSRKRARYFPPHFARFVVILSEVTRFSVFRAVVARRVTQPKNFSSNLARPVTS